ncbi:MAG: YcxB family protein [Clostridia bacterium]|nr:YcxB family protein [Clostridia bacterium]MBQ9720442.1 YcxB family protein [Oscillospiraceae bacterium]
MKGKEITVRVRLDAKTFRRFSSFDMLRLRKRWVRPVVFALILIAFSVAALLTGREQAGLIAAVLLVVGLGLPLVYFGTYFSQLNVRAAELKPPKAVYTVRMSFEGIHVTNDRKAEESVEVKWGQLSAAYRDRGCVYLYVNPARAFLLPDGQADVPDDELWAYLVKHMQQKCKAL